MKKFLFIVGMFLAFGADRAEAYNEVVEVYRSSATIYGMKCSSGAVTQIDSTSFGVLKMAGTQNRGAIRIQNHDSADSVFIGYSVLLSTDVNAPANLGEELAGGSPGANATYPIGSGLNIYCKSADSAGAGGVVISVNQLGYK